MSGKKRIAVLFGGCSNEYGVSLESAHAVISRLNKEKYEAVPVGITRDGKWFRFYGDVELLPEDKWCNPADCVPAFLSPDRARQGLVLLGSRGAVTDAKSGGVPPELSWEALDVVFPVLHGKNGEDGTVQGLLELSGIPFVGCGMLSSAMGMDKDVAHLVVAAAGVKVPSSFVLTEMEWKRMGKRVLGKAGMIGYPLYVKPVRAGSSFGISKVEREEDLRKAVEEAFLVDDKVMVEEEIKGFEVGCSVLGNNELTLGMVDEIELAGGFFDYKEKYHRQTAKVHMPARIDKDTAERIQKTAETIYRSLGCRGFTRVDMFLTPEKEVVFNEVNTIPGLTVSSRFPSMLGAVGISFPDMLDRLIILAEE